jgi:hypothetical protein
MMNLLVGVKIPCCVIRVRKLVSLDNVEIIIILIITIRVTQPNRTTTGRMNSDFRTVFNTVGGNNPIVNGLFAVGRLNIPSTETTCVRTEINI